MNAFFKDEKYVHFKFHPELNLPIYLKVNETIADVTFEKMMREIGFFKEKTEDFEKSKTKIYATADSRILTINPPSVIVRGQIDSALESDRYGEESIVPKEGHRIYRMRSSSLMIFSYAVREWSMALSPDSQMDKIKIALNRYLALALAPHGVIGFFGHQTADGVAVMRARSAMGESIYFDLQKNIMIGPDGTKKLDAGVQFLRFDNSVSRRATKMTREELFSFLTTHCSYINYEGLSIPARQMIHSLTKFSTGFRLSREMSLTSEY